MKSACRSCGWRHAQTRGFCATCLTERYGVSANAAEREDAQQRQARIDALRKVPAPPVHREVTIGREMFIVVWDGSIAEGHGL